MTTLQIIELIILIVILIIVAIIKFSVPSYLKQKGKNLADKEDIADLTKKVENVKSDFNEKIEYLKTDLTFLNQNRISVKSLEREALLLVNEKYAEWLNSLMNISFSLITIKNYNNIESYFSELKHAKIGYENAEAKLLIFMNDQKLLDIKTDCYIKTLELEQLIKQTTNTLQTDFELIDFYFSNVNPNTKEEIEKKQEDYKEAMDGISKTINGFYHKRAEMFDEIHPRRVRFVSLLQERLLKVMKEDKTNK